MTKAESAMQQAKSAGRDCLRFFALSEAQRRGYRASMGIGEEVQLALKENRIVLAHQPVVDATTHAVRYHERSEEHTSELQSLMRISYAVFCLKKKKE